MPTYTVTELITRSYYLSSIVGKGFQTVSGEQLNDGLQLLNSLLSIKTANQRLIPYFKQYDFTAVPNQEIYFIPKLILAETLTFTIGTVRYSTIPEPRRNYFGSGRVNNISSLPYQWHFERVKDGANIYLYFLPDTTYPLQLWGKFSLSDVTLNQDLLLILDRYYIEYLRYALAEYICQENNIIFQPQSEAKLSEFENMIFDISPMDMTMSKMSSLQIDSGINYADVNIGRGWRP